jgi:hypothetical protein
MKTFVLAMCALGVLTGPALANECPALQAQIDTAFGNRFDGTASSVRSLAAQAWALHQGGKHEESVKKYDEAAAAGKLELKHMR